MEGRRRNEADAAGAPKVRPTGNGRFKLLASPAPGATGIPSADHDQGRRARTVASSTSTVKGPDGTPVHGYLDQNGDWWLTTTSLAPGDRIQRDARGSYRTAASPTRKKWIFTTVTPTGGLGARVVPGDNEVVGVGQPIAVRFTGPVVNKAAVEARLDRDHRAPVEGSWHWMSDTEMHWRPASYWPANTEVWFDGTSTASTRATG